MWRGATFKPPPLWRRGGLWGGRGVLPVATAMVHAWSAASAGGGGCGWGRGPLAVAGVEVPAVGAVGEAVRGSQADPVVWVAGQGCLW